MRDDPARLVARVKVSGLASNEAAMTQSTTFDFRSKYTRTHPLTRFLLDGFWGAVEELVRRANPRRVLEVGCGEGFSTLRLRAILPQAELQACDVEERLVASCASQQPPDPHFPAVHI